MHRTFGSRFLINTLSHLGFCTSYSEVRKFELNTAVSHGIDLSETTDKHTVQSVADNVDQNAATIDGQNTFHGMGMIAVVTPGVSKPKKIPRKKVIMQDVQAIGSDWYLLLQVINLTTVISATYKNTFLFLFN